MAKASFKDFMLGPIRKAEKQITPAYQNILRSHAAQNYGWEKTAVDNLNMRYKENHHVITYSDDRVIDTENGTPDNPPAAAIRTFMINQAGKY
jgi:hypothetical protein